MFKPDKIPKPFSNVNVDELFKIENLVTVKNVVVSEKIKEEFKILKTTEKDMLIFLKNAQQHYLEACKHILLKSSITNSFLKKLRCLGPIERCKNRSISQLLNICKYLPFHVDTDVLINEWTLSKLEKVDEKSTELRIDHYWKQFFTKTNLSGGEKYPNVSKIVKACLSLVHGSADIERSFSCSGRILTEDRVSMCERTLNAILYSKDALKHYNNKLHLVLITKELINMARGAYLHYKDYLEDKKKFKNKIKKPKKKNWQKHYCLKNNKNN
ncbi:unnamed protein product [Macrosiphum euphorbiae]|uniref:HAT C-terminal dimerisation domain-containing protein n=1 Tax=Macrosiphum euphorbiae TaxID=13131 RepID=A0AAV0Y125_9HEMI|nr:unnamed protein product [Macrosiphum euphorbiae]